MAVLSGLAKLACLKMGVAAGPDVGGDAAYALRVRALVAGGCLGLAGGRLGVVVGAAVGVPACAALLVAALFAITSFAFALPLLVDLPVRLGAFSLATLALPLNNLAGM